MNTKNPIDSSETTQTQPLDALILLVVKAAEHCPQDLADRLVEACDALEEEHDTLKAQLDKREFQYRALCTDHRMEKLDAEEERDALKAQLKKREFQYREMEAKRDALIHENVRLHRIIDGLRDQVAVSASTVADQISEWAEANYSNSHEAQAVVEGCYDTEELEAFGSLEAFKEHAGIRDDYREDIIAMGGE